jgi:hypothetical protein
MTDTQTHVSGCITRIVDGETNNYLLRMNVRNVRMSRNVVIVFVLKVHYIPKVASRIGRRWLRMKDSGIGFG